MKITLFLCNNSFTQKNNLKIKVNTFKNKPNSINKKNNLSIISIF